MHAVVAVSEASSRTARAARVGRKQRRRAALVLLAVCALSVGCGAAAAKLPHYHQVDALYVIDHAGANPRTDTALVPYSRAFEKVLASCRTNANDLTNVAIALAEKASDLGGRTVTNLEMLQAIARRISWPESSPHGCGFIDDLAEAHMEAGGP